MLLMSMRALASTLRVSLIGVPASEQHLRFHVVSGTGSA
jgi:hypothetical protein